VFTILGGGDCDGGVRGRQELKGIMMIASSSKEKHGRVLVLFVDKKKEGLGTVMFERQWWFAKEADDWG
jgi:hypothetical protein